jgi:hypothetical protein
MSRDEKVNLGHARCIVQTPDAIQVQIDGEKTPRWIPQSQVHDDSDVYKLGTEGNLIVTLWWAEQKGLA